MDAINTALSGLNAATRRLAVSAENTANQQTENYRAQKLEQEALDSGGVRTNVVEKNPATITAVNTEGETVELPNVSLEEEVAQQVISTYTYKANLRTIQVAQDLQESLLNITT